MSKLIACRVCNQPVSVTAEFCPHCGEREPNPTVFKYQSIFMTVVLVVVLVFVLFKCLS
jgi:hypothetical protein